MLPQDALSSTRSDARSRRNIC